MADNNEDNDDVGGFSFPLFQGFGGQSPLGPLLSPDPRNRSPAPPFAAGAAAPGAAAAGAARVALPAGEPLTPLGGAADHEPRLHPPPGAFAPNPDDPDADLPLSLSQNLNHHFSQHHSQQHYSQHYSQQHYSQQHQQHAPGPAAHAAHPAPPRGRQHPHQHPRPTHGSPGEQPCPARPLPSSQQRQPFSQRPRPQSQRGPSQEGGAPGTLLDHLIRCGAMDAVVVEDAAGQPRLADGPLSVQVDVMSLINADPDLGMRFMQEPGPCLHELLEELHREELSASPCPRLALRPDQVPLPCQPIPALLATLPRTLAALYAHASAPDGAPSSPAAPPGPAPTMMVCCHGVVSAASSLGLRPHSRQLVCVRCGAAAEVLEERGAEAWPGCGCSTAGLVGPDVQEDLSGRVMVPCQDVWLSGLTSAAPARGHSARQGCLRVAVADDLAGVAKVGDVVRVVGMARVTALPPAGAARAPPGGAPPTGSSASTVPSLYTAAAFHIDALSLQPAAPHAAWVLPAFCSPTPSRFFHGAGGLTAEGWGARDGGVALDGGGGGAACSSSPVLSGGRPLQLLLDLLCQLQRRPVEPLLGLALLASAAAAGGAGGEGGGAGEAAEKAAGQVPQPAGSTPGSAAAGKQLLGGRIRILLGCAPGDPLCTHLLLSCAHLLSPHSASLSAACAAAAAGVHDDPPPLAPRLAAGARLDGSGQAGGVAHGSVLLVAGNRGIAVLDADVLSTRQKTQLGEVLSRPSLPLAPGRAELTLPVHPTLWAAAPGPDAGDTFARPADSGAAWSGRGGGGRGGGGKGGGGKGDRAAWGGLDPGCFDLVLVHEAGDEALAAVLDAGSLDDPHSAGAPDDASLLRLLRHHVALAAHPRRPAPQLSGEALELLMRYYVAVRQAGVQVTQSEVLGSLVAVASACARLHLRSQVLQAPDCVLAVMLMERTLQARFGDAYVGLGLGPLPECGGEGVEGAGGVGEGWLAEDEDGVGGGGQGGPCVDEALVAMASVLGRVLQGYMVLG